MVLGSCQALGTAVSKLLAVTARTLRFGGTRPIVRARETPKRVGQRAGNRRGQRVTDLSQHIGDAAGAGGAGIGGDKIGDMLKFIDRPVLA